MTAMPEGPITLREVYSLVESSRKELLAEIRGVEITVEAKLTTHEAVHDKHEQRHVSEHEQRRSMIRWAVTSLMTGAGVLVALYVAFRT